MLKYLKGLKAALKKLYKDIKDELLLEKDEAVIKSKKSLKIEKQNKGFYSFLSF